MYCHALFRGQHHHHCAAFKLGHLLNGRKVFNFSRNLTQQLSSASGEGDFASPEHACNLDLVFALQEFSNVAQFGLQVVLAGLGAYFYFLELKGRLFLFGFLLLFGLLVLKATIIHDFAYRRFGIWRYFHQIEPKLSGGGKRFLDRHDANLIAIRINYPNFAHTNIGVNPGSWLLGISCEFIMSYVNTS